MILRYGLEYVTFEGDNRPPLVRGNQWVFRRVDFVRLYQLGVKFVDAAKGEVGRPNVAIYLDIENLEVC